MKQDVVRFYISVHDVATGKHFECLHHLPEEIQGPFLGEGAFLLHQFVHRASVTILIDEVEIVGSLKHIDVFDDVGAALKSRKNVDLVDSAFLQLGDLFKFLSLDDLDSNLLLGHQMYRFVDLSVDTFSQMFLQLVILYDLAHHR